MVHCFESLWFCEMWFFSFVFGSNLLKAEKCYCWLPGNAESRWFKATTHQRRFSNLGLEIVFEFFSRKPGARPDQVTLLKKTRNSGHRKFSSTTNIFIAVAPPGTNLTESRRIISSNNEHLLQHAHFNTFICLMMSLCDWLTNWSTDVSVR